MTRVKLFLMRHSKSCSNHTRSAAHDTEDRSDPAVMISQGIRDPGLSVIGSRNAKLYGSRLRDRLIATGFDVDGALVCASTLRRAQDTARLIFGRKPSVLPAFAENGKLPENTPQGCPYAPPKWSYFIAHLSTMVKDGDSIAVVGHGSYLRSLWPRLTGSEHKDRLNNLDGILLDADIDRRGIRVHSFKEILYDGPAMNRGSDKCVPGDLRKIAVLNRMGQSRKSRNRSRNSRNRSRNSRNRSRRTRPSRRRQNGGGTWPLAYFSQGAQMRGTSGEPTGLSLGPGTSDGMVRASLMSTTVS